MPSERIARLLAAEQLIRPRIAKREAELTTLRRRRSAYIAEIARTAGGSEAARMLGMTRQAITYHEERIEDGRI